MYYDTVSVDNRYHWCYVQGLKGRHLKDVYDECAANGVSLRNKDVENYWNGINNSRNRNQDTGNVLEYPRFIASEKDVLDMDLSEFPLNPRIGEPEIENRWVPCIGVKPMIKWGNGTMSKTDAMSWPKATHLAENLKGTRLIVVDCDGDHNKEAIDHETVAFLARYQSITHTLSSQSKYNINVAPHEYAVMPASFHLTFTTDRILPTKHYPEAHVDLCGNKMNQLRYLKNKQWNGLPPHPLTEEIWREIRAFLSYRKDKYLDGIVDNFDGLGAQ